MNKNDLSVRSPKFTLLSGFCLLPTGSVLIKHCGEAPKGKTITLSAEYVTNIGWLIVSQRLVLNWACSIALLHRYRFQTTSGVSLCYFERVADVGETLSEARALI